MTIYTCNICNISTHLKNNYMRHLKTKKHINNENKYGVVLEKGIKMTTNDHKMTKNYSFLTTNDHKMTTNDHKMTTNMSESNIKEKGEKSFKCEHCFKTFTTKPHLSRHLSNYCKQLKKVEKSESALLKNMLDEQKNIFDEERKHLYTQIEYRHV